MNYGVHQSHCCNKHGCKYGSENCPVTRGEIRQTYPCETCDMTPRADGGFYDRNLVWHPNLQEILAAVADQLGPNGTGHVAPETLRDLHFAARQIVEGVE